MDHDKFARVEVTSQAALWDWFAANHATTDSIWLVTWKAAHRDRYISRDEVLDAVIAHGWIDGRRLKLDDDRTMQLLSPRKQQSWAETYRARAARLESEGRMHPAGRAALERGRQSGVFDAMAHVDALVDPDDLSLALTRSGGLVWWQNAAPSYRRNILRWIGAARQPQTRQKRIDTAASLAAEGRKVPQY
jgi:uncharacterized protein YdeI (YjbR/CyaY-like superfamily)